jgi:hypothetical protein
MMLQPGMSRMSQGVTCRVVLCIVGIEGTLVRRYNCSCKTVFGA